MDSKHRNERLRWDVRSRRRNYRTFPFSAPALSPLGCYRPSVSVVLPVFNQVKYISQSIASILAAIGDFPFEIIVVDDGSTEDIESEIQSFLVREHCSLIKLPHAGIAAALNVGFANTRGEYVTWTSADNCYHPGAIRQLREYLHGNPYVGLTYGNVRLFDEAGRPITQSDYRKADQHPEHPAELLLPVNGPSLKSMDDNFINACFLYRREAAEFVGNYRSEHLGYEDYDYWLRLSLGFEIAHIDTDAVLYDYRLHQHSLTSRLDWENVNNHKSKRLAALRSVFSKLESEPAISYAALSASHVLALRPPETPTFVEKALLSVEQLGILRAGSRSAAEGISPRLCLQPTVETNSLLRRSRDSDHGAISPAAATGLRALIFPFAQPSAELLLALETLINRETNLTFALFCGTQSERLVADTVHLRLQQKEHFRIIDVQEDPLLSQVQPRQLEGLMYALSSAEALIGFLPERATFDEAVTLLAQTAAAAYAGLPFVLCTSPRAANSQYRNHPSSNPYGELAETILSRVKNAPHVICWNAVDTAGRESLSDLILQACQTLSLNSLDQWLLATSRQTQLRRTSAFTLLHLSGDGLA